MNNKFLNKVCDQIISETRVKDNELIPYKENIKLIEGCVYL